MSARSYSIVEPHSNPSASAHYISTGRGGAGNAFCTKPSQLTRGADASGPASASAAAQLIRISLASSSSTKPVSTTSSSHPRNYSTGGRGGAGNVFPVSERTIFSFDEELERQLRWERNVAPVYHVGRGGAGNLMRGSGSSFDAKPQAPRRRTSEDSTSTGHASFESSGSRGSESGADVFNRSVKNGWKKITGY